jgi:hypothetical protein
MTEMIAIALAVAAWLRTKLLHRPPLGIRDRPTTKKPAPHRASDLSVTFQQMKTHARSPHA